MVGVWGPWYSPNLICGNISKGYLPWTFLAESLIWGYITAEYVVWVQNFLVLFRNMNHN